MDENDLGRIQFRRFENSVIGMKKEAGVLFIFNLLNRKSSSKKWSKMAKNTDNLMEKVVNPTSSILDR